MPGRPRRRPEIPLLLLGLGTLLAGAAGALRFGASPKRATAAGMGGALAGCALMLYPVLKVLGGSPPLALRLPWSIPMGAFSLALDPLSAFFLLPTLGLSGIAAIYGGPTLLHKEEGRRAGQAWGFFNLLVASMVLVLLARDGVLFLMAWELMSLASFFLVVLDHEDEAVRHAGWTYLVAAHLATACLLAFFVGLQLRTGSFDLAPLPSGAVSGSLFLLALLGFGTKAGLVPLHVWLPEAHPAAPSHVSALMSGVMVATGLYGLLRILPALGPPATAWGWLLVWAGLGSALLGILLALAQRDLKRLLAYSTVENVGIACLGMGLGVLGVSRGSPALAVLGFAGALLHVLHHAVMKGGLFLAAGTVLHGTGSRDLERLGGLLRRMPWTGAAFLVCAAAISGLPPLCGFAGEFLVTLGALGAGISGSVSSGSLLAAVAGLALAGGLAVACFSKAFGIAFLGEPRSPGAAWAQEAAPGLRLPATLLAACCLLLGLASPWTVRLLSPVLQQVTGLPTEILGSELAKASDLLAKVQAVGVALLACVAALAAFRLWLLSGREVGSAVTWDCGYVRPSPRMQYSATSFAQPLTRLFRSVLGLRTRTEAPAGYFPQRASVDTACQDPCTETLYRPLFSGVQRAVSGIRWFQHGRLQLYVLYIAVTLLALLVWKLQ